MALALYHGQYNAFYKVQTSCCCSVWNTSGCHQPKEKKTRCTNKWPTTTYQFSGPQCSVLVFCDPLPSRSRALSTLPVAGLWAFSPLYISLLTQMCALTSQPHLFRAGLAAPASPSLISLVKVLWDGEMAQQVEAAAARPDDLSLILEPTW